jgi:cyclophilin family peptidyl-prolyl cis-trans isomerase
MFHVKRSPASEAKPELAREAVRKNEAPPPPCSPRRSASRLVRRGARSGAVTLGVALVCACSSARPAQDGPRAPASGPPSTVTQTPRAAMARAADPRNWFAAADGRVFSAGLREALVDADPTARAAATLAVARLHDLAARGALGAALADPDPRVRQAASLGLSALEDDAPADVRARLLGATATETDLATRAVLLADLGRVAGPEAEPALAAALRDEPPTAREAACRAVGAMGLRGRAVAPPLLEAVAARVAGDVTPAVRLACAWSISRQPSPPSPSTETLDALTRAVDAAAADPDPEIRLMAARVWGAHSMLPVTGLVALTRDVDWRVVAQAFRALGRRSDPAHDGPYASALRALLDARLPQDDGARISANDGPDASGPPSASTTSIDHGFRVALEEATAIAAGTGVAPIAEEALRRLGATGAEAPRGVGLAHCLASRLVDIARGWPQRVFRCGLGAVGESERDAHAAEVLRRVSGDPAGRAGYLLRLYERGDLRVREAVLAATAAVDDGLSTRLVVRGLGEADVGVVTTALEAVVARPARFLAYRSEASTARPAPAAADGGASSAEEREMAAVSPLDATLRAALVAAHTTLARTNEIEGLLRWLEAVAALGDTSLLPEARAHATATNFVLRRAARTTVQALATRLALHASGSAALGSVRDGGAEPDASTAFTEFADSEARPVADAIAANALPRADERLRAVLTVDAGEIEIELLPAEAPTTVARFVALVERGFYDGLRFHRVVPGFVVQGGDPRGDGYGGPGFTQRCEDNRVRYERGTVGMALAGRDTGGSQFFIAQSAQPHLDGRYTAFGRVVRGQDYVDGLLPDDVLRRVRIERGAL